MPCPDGLPPAPLSARSDDERLTIDAVACETGLSKHVLRAWERRYGFPAPLRDARGNRVYTRADVARLLQIKRLVSAGFRPGKMIGPA